MFEVGVQVHPVESVRMAILPLAQHRESRPMADDQFIQVWLAPRGKSAYSQIAICRNESLVDS